MSLRKSLVILYLTEELRGSTTSGEKLFVLMTEG
jgi:hypothetical protein